MSERSTSPIRPIALITGASRGLGRSMALSLAQRGWDLVITYRERADQADTLRQEVEALGGCLVALALDVGQAGQFPGFVAQVEAALQAQWGGRRLQALVNNAGVGIYAPLAELTEAQFDALVAVHLKGPFFLTQALLPLLADGGRIVNISSGLTRFSLPGYGAYASMKGAIEVFTRYLAKELGARGIAVNTVAPGAIETDFGGPQCATNRRSRPSSPRRPPWAVLACRRTSARWWPACCRPISAGSMPSASRCRAACFSEPRGGLYVQTRPER
jgi:NAD(P)-dependent dehydrogenase (short-subunit alcohol dehydrogenase family)